MKILQIVPNLKTGGAETMVENLSKALSKDNEVVVVSLFSEKTFITERLEQAGIRIVYLDKKPGFDFSLLKKINRLVKEEKPDVIHTHLYVLPYVYLARKTRKIPVFHTFHSIAQNEQKKKLGKVVIKLMLKKRLTPVGISQAVQNSISEVYGLKAERIPVVDNCVDMNNCIVKTSADIGETFNVISVARLSKPKNHMLMLETFNELLTRVDNSRLWLVGDGELREEVENKIAELGVGEKVKMFGNTSNVYPILHEANVFIFTSLYEGLPMSLLEAIGTGLPIVSTIVGGIPDVITDGKEGYLVDADSKKLADALERIYADKQIRDAMSKNAIETSKKYSSDVMAEKYLGVYKARL